MVLGKVGRPHGLRGDFFVSGRAEPIPMSYGDVWIGAAPESATRAKLQASRRQGERCVTRCSLAATREEAQLLTGQLVFGRVPAGDGWVWGELEGLEVVAADGVRLGRIHQVYNAGASDVIEVHGEGRRRIDLPLVDDYFAVGAPLTGGRITLKVPAATFADLWTDA